MKRQLVPVTIYGKTTSQEKMESPVFLLKVWM